MLKSQVPRASLYITLLRAAAAEGTIWGGIRFSPEAVEATIIMSGIPIPAPTSAVPTPTELEASGRG